MRVPSLPFRSGFRRFTKHLSKSVSTSSNGEDSEAHSADVK
jgi:hypothetical protein